MKRIWNNISKYLPLIAGLFVLCYAVDAFAGVADFFGGLAAKALGIDTSDNCVPPQSHTGCLFCPLFKVLYSAGNTVAAKAYSAFHSDLGKVVGLFLSVSLALIILKNIASMNSQDPGTIINDILNKTFVGIAIYIIVTQDYHNVLNLTLVPIFTSGLEFVSLDSVDITSCASAAGIGGFSSHIGANEEAGIPSQIGTTLICSAEYIESKINTLFEYGRWGFCRGMGPDRLWHIIPHPIYLVDSLVLYLGGIFFTVAYPWVLGDAILQLGISMALMPFAVAGYAFKGTKQYLSTVFNWILHTLFVFMFMMILITCLLTYIEGIINTAAASSGNPKVFFTYPVRGIAFFGPNMFMIIFVLIIGYTYMPQIAQLADQFSKGSALSAAKKFGTFLTDQLDKQAEKVADKAVDIAKDAAVTTGRVSVRRFNAAVRQSVLEATLALGKTDAAGNKRMHIPMIGTFTAHKNADGSMYLKRERTNFLNGRKHVMVSDKYSTIYQEYDRHGNLIKSKVEFKHNFAKKHLLNKDGTINVEAYKVLMDSNLAKDPEFKKAIMAQVAADVAKARGYDIGKHFRSRTVTLDPRNPNKISIEQIDQTGKKTRLSMDINMTTGQVITNFEQARGRNRYDKVAHTLNTERKYFGRWVNTNLAAGAINLLSFGRGTVNLGFIKYRVTRDAYGNLGYERDILSRSGAILRPWTWRFHRNIKQYDWESTSHINNAQGTTRTKYVDDAYSEEIISFFDNGSFSVQRTGRRDPATGAIIDEETRITYSAAVQDGHAGISGGNESAQVVDSSGNLASDINRAEFFADIDDLLSGTSAYAAAYTAAILPAATTAANIAAAAAGIPILPGDPQYDALLNAALQQEKENFVLQNIFAPARRLRTPKIATRFGFSI